MPVLAMTGFPVLPSLLSLSSESLSLFLLGERGFGFLVFLFLIGESLSYSLDDGEDGSIGFFLLVFLGVLNRRCGEMRGSDLVCVVVMKLSPHRPQESRLVSSEVSQLSRSTFSLAVK